MSRLSKPVRLPGDDEAKLEGFAASLAAHQGIKFDQAKERMVKEYGKAMRNATTGGRVDEDKFREQMDKFIQRNAIPK